ncbi:intermembrane transport protein PqiB [Allohahella marinimesophila]|uniref:Mce/MlaD domain-containing protein n=1 Tax=Allohahella marinimesophila TaxID=1054972 RepID=A0ABP7NJ21_9GAMM
MTEHDTHLSEQAHAPEVRARGISAVWLVPAIALLIAAWLGVRAWLEASIPVEVTFETADGLVEGKTEVRYRGMSLGRVADIKLSADLQNFLVTINMEHDSERLLNEGTRFWIVKPRISLAGVSGLDTVLTGNYIGIQPGEGERKLSFEGLRLPPPPEETTGDGLWLKLTAQSLGSINTGSAVYYKSLSVGTVERVDLLEDATALELLVRIDPQYAYLVGERTRFFRMNPVEFSSGADGFELQTGPLVSLVQGGIGMTGVNTEATSDAELDSRHYRLLDKAPPARRRATGLNLVLHAPSRGSLKSGTAVTYRQVRVGEVLGTRLSPEADRVEIFINIDRQWQSLVNSSTRFWNASGFKLEAGLVSGLSIESESVESLLTGGVAFFTPPGSGAEPVKQNAAFALADKPREQWLDWQDKLPPVRASDAPSDLEAPAPRPEDKASKLRREKRGQSGPAG